jgi:hypothetical protein
MSNRIVITPENTPILRSLRWSVGADVGTFLERRIAHLAADLADLETRFAEVRVRVAIARQHVEAAGDALPPRVLEEHRLSVAQALAGEDELPEVRASVHAAIAKWGRELAVWRKYNAEMAEENLA